METLYTIGTKIDGLLQRERGGRLEIGKLLIEAKRLAKHGEWIPFVEARGLERTSAFRYMEYATKLLASNVAVGNILPSMAALGIRDDSTPSVTTLNALEDVAAFVKQLPLETRKALSAALEEPESEVEKDRFKDLPHRSDLEQLIYDLTVFDKQLRGAVNKASNIKMMMQVVGSVRVGPIAGDLTLSMQLLLNYLYQMIDMFKGDENANNDGSDPRGNAASGQDPKVFQLAEGEQSDQVIEGEFKVCSS